MLRELKSPLVDWICTFAGHKPYDCVQIVEESRLVVGDGLLLYPWINQ